MLKLEIKKEITRIFKSSDFIKNQQRYYKDNKTVITSKDKASETNYALHPLAKRDLANGKKLEIYELDGTKKDNIDKYRQQHKGRAPCKNFQANKEKIPKEIIKQYEKDKKN